MEAGSGERLGRYVLTRRLGAGGMAEVFEAVDELLRRRVAVKVVRGPLSESGEFTTRFLREARLAAQLRHPNVVPIYDVGVDRGVLFVVMPVLEGGTLSDRVVAGVADGTSLDWLAALASALDYAHGRGVVHRDVKPQNVLFDEAGGLQLSDFGLARSLEETTQLTQTGAVLGTPVYMSPEQVNGTVVGPASDQYALGVLAFRLLTGRLPIEKAPAPVIFQKTLFEPLPAPSSFRQGLPPGVDAAMARALAKRPGERFPSCSAFVDALGQALGLALSPSRGRGAGDLPTTLLSGSRQPTLPPTVAVTPPSRPSRATTTGATPRPPPTPPAPPEDGRSPLPLPSTSRTLWSDASSTRAAPPSVPLPVVLIGLGLAVALALAIGVSLARRGGSGASRQADPAPSPAAPAVLPPSEPSPTVPPAPPASPIEEPTPPPLGDVTVVEVFPSPTAVTWAIPSMARRPTATAPPLLPPPAPPPAPPPLPAPTHGAYLFPTAIPGSAPWPTATPTPAPPPTPTRPAPTPSTTPRPTTPPDPLASVPRTSHPASLHLEKAVLHVERSAYVIALDFSEDLDSEESVGHFASLKVTTRGGVPLLRSAEGLATLACEGLPGNEVRCEVRKALTRFSGDDQLTEDDRIEVRGVVGGFDFSGSMTVDD